jgi:hypothetical protein
VGTSRWVGCPHLGSATFKEFLHVHQEIRDRTTHDQLQKDLIEH